MAAIIAMMESRLIGVPSDKTADIRSTSVSKIRPRSAPAATVASQIAFMASLFSGFGIWFGNVPSGSRKLLPVVSAPSSSSTSLTKKPPAPFPASTTIFKFFSGAS